LAGIYRPRHPERTALYRVLFYYFDRFLADYERRFDKDYGFFRPIVKEMKKRLERRAQAEEERTKKKGR
jgi:hypothetical protein